MHLRIKITLTFLLAIAVATQWGCEKKHSMPLLPEADEYPGAPQDVKATIGDRVVKLTWSRPDSGVVVGYRIFRRDSLNANPSLIDSVGVESYTDEGLRNGTLYYYRVSAVNAAGFEGPFSAEVTARPDLYDLVIEAGVEYINRPAVDLEMTAPTKTAYMKISNNSTLAGARWEPFDKTRKNWTLSLGDGPKSVYVLFKDEEGNETSEPVSDDIVLDTQATILDVTEDTGGEPRVSGDVIQFTLNAGEPKGQASVDIKDGPKGIQLYDDGTQGDHFADDGIYEVSWTVPADVEVMDGKVTGRFTDRVGNVAKLVDSVGKITIQQPPNPVTLYTPVASVDYTVALQLTWTVSQDSLDFGNYAIYRSNSSGVTRASTLVATVVERETHTYTDTKLEAGKVYYYRVFVYDNQGFSAPSNEVSAQASLNEPPAPVTLATPTSVDSVTLKFTWTKNDDPDFASYRIYRSVSSPVDTAGAPVAILNSDPKRTEYIDTGLRRDTDYYYRVFVFDRSGLSSGSNEVHGRTKQ